MNNYKVPGLDVHQGYPVLRLGQSGSVVIGILTGCSNATRVFVTAAKFLATQPENIRFNKGVSPHEGSEKQKGH